MKPRRSYGTKALSAKGRVRMAQSLVTNCRPEKLAEMTAPWLANAHGIPLPEAERMLSVARQVRVGRRQA